MSKISQIEIEELYHEILAILDETEMPYFLEWQETCDKIHDEIQKFANIHNELDDEEKMGVI